MDLSFDLNVSKKTKFDYEKSYDLAIIGGGPGGLSAALYAKRKGLDVVIISKDLGGQVSDTTTVENYLGIQRISGEELVRQFKKHIESYDVKVLKDVLVKRIENNDFKDLILDNGKVLKSRAIIISTGTINRRLNVPGEKEFYGKGVAYCAICDGPLFEGKDVIVAGGGNSAVEAAIDLSKIANSVKLVQRSVLRADKVLIDKLEEMKNVDIYVGHQIKELKGDKTLKKVIAVNRKTEKQVEFKADGLFVEIGYIPNSKFVEGTVELSDKKEIIINQVNETSEEGIFAVGDVTTVSYKQIIIAASEGAKAALSAVDYLNKK